MTPPEHALSIHAETAKNSVFFIVKISKVFPYYKIYRSVELYSCVFLSSASEQHRAEYSVYFYVGYFYDRF